MMDRSTLLSFRAPRFALRALITLCAGVAAISPVRAASPRLQFDVSTTVACRDVTPHDFAIANPAERLVEARFQISLLSQLGPDREAAELLIRIESPDDGVQVADYFPKTTLTSEFAGPISVEQHEEREKSIDLKFDAQSLAAHAGGSASEHAKATLHTQGQRLPPMELCAASGTVRRGHGVYFKLKPTSRSSLEGAHDFRLVLRTPTSWRGDHLLVNCEAFGIESSFASVSSTRTRWAARSFVVALYQESDTVAQSRAANLIRAERELRSVAANHRQELGQRSRPNPLQEIESLFKRPTPKLPENWLEQVVYGQSDIAQTLQDRLPNEVRVAALNYRDAKRQLQQFGGNVEPHAVAKPVIALANHETTPVRAKNLAPSFDRLPPVD